MDGGKRMKKLLTMLILPMTIFLTSCSTIEEVSNSLNYVTEATNYIDDVNQFANELPTVAEAAINNLNSKIQLEELLIEMQNEIEGFNILEAPAMLEDIHNQVVEHNKELASGIELYLENIEAGTLSSELLSEIGLLEEIAVYNDLLSQIKKLSE
jgi:PBP1b-binding outer membrane lipoprotein LpoB